MKSAFILAGMLFISIRIMAQHQHNMPMPDTKKAAKDTAKMKPDGMDMNMQMDTMPVMSHSYSLNLPMNRNSSGTAWQPDATSMYGYMKMGKKWNLMFHGSIFFRYNYQDINNSGVRGDSLKDRFDAPNWVMLMANRKVNTRGLFAFTLMLSADELVMGGNGYPLLFQTGKLIITSHLLTGNILMILFPA